MKTSIFTHRMIVYVLNVLLFFGLWGVWYLDYCYTLIWLEGFSYFSTLPDFTSIQMDLPRDVFRYAGAFLLQFFRVPLLGAAIQAALAIWIVICVEFCIFRLTKNVRLTWLAFLLLPVFVAGQYGDITLERSMLWCTIAGFAAVLSCFMLLKKEVFHFPKWTQSLVFILSVPVLMLSFSVYLLMFKENDHRYQEELCRIDYHANKQEWEQVLKIVPPQTAKRDEFKLRYALLALSETGKLADQAFRYGFNNHNQYLFYGNEDPFERAFNAFFYQSLGMPNEVVHQAYQLSMISPFGFNFKSLRMLVDASIEMGDYLLAAKYMEILRHSTFHSYWVEKRLALLNSIKMEESHNDDLKDSPFVGNILETLTSLVNQNPTDRKIVDLCLCAILTTGNAEYFHRAFQFVYPGLYANGERIPRYYEEALLLIALHEKEVLKLYSISKESRERFSDFVKLYQNGKTNAAKAKYPDSYWSFVLP